MATGRVYTSMIDGVAATTTELLRTGGWQVLNSSGNTTEEWAGIISLGSLASTDQVYYDQLNDETTDNTVDFKGYCSEGSGSRHS